MFTIEDYDEFTIPVNQLTTTKNALINFKDFLPANDYGKQWRYRIDKLRVLALDKDGVLIQSPGTGFGEGISLGVTFPSIFNDTDSERQHHTFLAQHFYCRSTYVTYGKYFYLVSKAPKFKNLCLIIFCKMFGTLHETDDKSLIEVEVIYVLVPWDINTFCMLLRFYGCFQCFLLF